MRRACRRVQEHWHLTLVSTGTWNVVIEHSAAKGHGPSTVIAGQYVTGQILVGLRPERAGSTPRGT